MADKPINELRTKTALELEDTDFMVGHDAASPAAFRATVAEFASKLAVAGPAGPPGPAGAAGPKGDPGPTGVGVPPGGTTGQRLAKNSATSYDTTWVDDVATWGNVTGTLANQTDLQNALDGKAADNAVVKLGGDQMVTGVKTFSNSPVIPAPATDFQAATKKYVDDSIMGGGGVTWGAITGTLSDQTDLQNALGVKADDAAVVKLAGDQSIAGVKTFANSPVIPAPSTDLQASTKKYVDDALTNQKHSAADITSGTLPVTRGGSGLATVAVNSYLKGNGTSALVPRTYAQVLSDIGAAADNAVVKLSGAQSVADVKTFAASPIVPTPTTDYQAATKKYVDDTVAPAKLQPFYVNPQANGASHIVFDEAMTLNLAAVRTRGTGTVVYAKSTDGTNFTNVSTSTSFAVNDVLRITVTGYSGYLTLTIPRTA